MIRQKPIRFLCFLSGLIAIGAAAVWCQGQSTPSRASIGPDSVWNPPSNSWIRLHQTCGNGDNPECLPAFMKQNGASAAAVAIAQRFHGESFITEFKAFGRVGLVTLTSPFRATANEAPVLVNGTPDLVDVSDEVNKLDPSGNATYASIKKIFPNAVFGATVPKFENVQNLSGGGQRFVFLISIRDGCSACDEVAIAQIALDFDQFAAYLGAKLLSVSQAGTIATADAETSHSLGADQKSHVATVAPDRLITNDSVGPVRIGMTISQARGLLPQFHLERATIGDGTIAYHVFSGKQTVMFLIPALKSRTSNRLDAAALVHAIEVVDPGYMTKAGVHPGMPLRDVEAIYGKLLRISMNEIEMQEFAAFPRLPAGILIRVSAEDKPAGIYPRDERTTTSYDSTARVQAVLVSAIGTRHPHPSGSQ
jgi:hypothetical protein